MTSFVNGKDMIYFSPRERRKKVFLSSAVIFGFIVIIVGVVRTFNTSITALTTCNIVYHAGGEHLHHARGPLQVSR